jgi:hypothetical protein
MGHFVQAMITTPMPLRCQVQRTITLSMGHQLGVCLEEAPRHKKTPSAVPYVKPVFGLLLAEPPVFLYDGWLCMMIQIHAIAQNCIIAKQQQVKHVLGSNQDWISFLLEY